MTEHRILLFRTFLLCLIIGSQNVFHYCMIILPTLNYRKMANYYPEAILFTPLKILVNIQSYTAGVPANRQIVR